MVAFEGAQTSFARLAQRDQHYVPVFLYVFDILWLEGHDVRPLPLRTRKRLLKSALQFHGTVRWTQYRNSDGEALFEEACRKGWEGLIAKRADSPYVTTRSKDWLKFKCEHGQELVIGGYTAPRGSRVEFGALLLGYYRDGRFEYAGKVGTGFDTDTLHDLGARLRELAREPTRRSPHPSAIRERHVTWVEPELVAQIGFTEWTRDGRLRHPRFLGLRDDKAASRGGARGVTETLTIGAARGTHHARRPRRVPAAEPDQARPRPPLRARRAADAALRARPPACAAGLPEGDRGGRLLHEVGARLLPGLDPARDRPEEGRDDHPRARRRTPRRSCTSPARTWSRCTPGCRAPTSPTSPIG